MTGTSRPILKGTAVTVQRSEVNQSVIPAKAGIHDENNVLSGFPIKAFGNDKFSCLVGVLPRAELLRTAPSLNVKQNN
jgi:hypothetical protein